MEQSIKEIGDYLIKNRIKPVDYKRGKAYYLSVEKGIVKKLCVPVPVKTRLKWLFSDIKTSIKAHVVGWISTKKLKMFGDGNPFHFDVHFYNTQTGERRVYCHPYGYSDNPYEHLFGWTDGNYSCDCNRSLLMYDHEKELPCSGEKNVIIIEKMVVRETGEIVAQNI
jgi:hypothetical protein